jgi:hypothetical protein
MVSRSCRTMARTLVHDLRVCCDLSSSQNELKAMMHITAPAMPSTMVPGGDAWLWSSAGCSCRDVAGTCHGTSLTPAATCWHAAGSDMRMRQQLANSGLTSEALLELNTLLTAS